MRDMLLGGEGAAPSPEAAAQKHMRPVLARRFYKNISVAKTNDGGLQILLDDKPVKTPARAVLALPNEMAAKLAAGEWQAQKSEINPALMPVTRLANTAIDGIMSDPQAVLEDILRFAANDLLFYRASNPDSLVAQQGRLWDPILDWISETTGARFETVEGVMHIAQPREAISLFSHKMAEHSEPFRLACLHTMTSLTGSALIPYALVEGHLELEAAWDAAHVDEDFNISQWGEDYEAAKRRKLRLVEMKAAHELFKALNG